MRPIVFNGKFYGGSLNGVHRVADRLIRAVDDELGAMPANGRPDARVILPLGASWIPELSTIRVVRERGAGTQAWEQAVLPRRAAGAVLVNLCNLAPIAHARKILLLHDVQFLFSDNSYPARQRLGYRFLTPLMARTSAQVLTVSEYSRRLMDLTGVAPLERTAVLPNGADHLIDGPAAPDGASRFGLAPGGYVLLFGSAKSYKNVRVVFEAFADPRLADLVLVVVGMAEAALRAAGLHPPAGARFVGKVADDALRTLYAEALCLAFPSRTEGFGLPPIEAALSGCPSVVAPAGAIPEVCVDAVLYAGTDAPGEWADAILGYATDPVLRAAKVTAARERARTFRWADAGRGLLAHILRLAR
ncbi:glycosyltransferase family 4 protein [Sphingomonas profundi]|uniref:glycosyltransferase family 4 protein n=1 Tax=Alterirhizorhabdus profundi TaxID=2681549 RepID=UPI0012E73A63|nr:glycosyltransferase family 1 protein [Sphingomonas profundi]